MSHWNEFKCLNIQKIKIFSLLPHSELLDVILKEGKSHEVMYSTTFALSNLVFPFHSHFSILVLSILFYLTTLLSFSIVFPLFLQIHM